MKQIHQQKQQAQNLPTKNISMSDRPNYIQSSQEILTQVKQTLQSALQLIQ